MNSVNLIGNLTADVRVFPAQQDRQTMITFSLALNESYRNREGQLVDRVSYVDCVCYGKRAETLSAYVSKGHKLGITGKLNQRTWMKDDKKQSALQVVVAEFTFANAKAAA